jgi:peptide chain release factor 2
LKTRLAELDASMNDPAFWQEKAKADKVVREASAIKGKIEPVEKITRSLRDADELAELAREESDDAVFAELHKDLDTLDKSIAALELSLLFSNPEDGRDAILAIHPGAGGTESMDWAEMLMRMYSRYCEQKGFDVRVLDISHGEEAGIKSVSFEIKGQNAYGTLKSESGVHRLVRISPYDAASRRHTSFASVFVYPEIESDIEVEIRDEDLRVDTYRASGAGGQHVNKTDSAVRITHEPTGIVVQCQSERSQLRNRENAMKILRARLYHLKLEEERKKLDEMMEGQKEIAWGNQIRSYVLHPYTMVKDHRTSAQVSDAERVLDGDLDEFVEAYLHKFATRT